LDKKFNTKLSMPLFAMGAYGWEQTRLESEGVELLPTVDLWAVIHAGDVRDFVLTSAAQQSQDG
jgi:hypothetical protein